jgi:hypothetical protein
MQERPDEVSSRPFSPALTAVNLLRALSCLCVCVCVGGGGPCVSVCVLHVRAVWCVACCVCSLLVACVACVCARALRVARQVNALLATFLGFPPVAAPAPSAAEASRPPEPAGS